MEIKKIIKQGPSKIIIVPKHSDLEIGDYVQLIKIKNPPEEVSLVADSSRGSFNKDNEKK